MKSGIISFKNLKAGLWPLDGGQITDEIITLFVIELDKLILEIFNTEIPFQEKELPVLIIESNNYLNINMKRLKI